METETEVLYLIWSNEHGGWWKPLSRGYTAEKKRAGLYTFDDALGICKGANIEEKDVPNETMVPFEVCAECLGTGEVTTMERVYPDDGSPVASIGVRACICKNKNHDNE